MLSTATWASNGVPSWNWTSSRTVNSHVLGLGRVQDVASPGTTERPASCLVRVSYTGMRKPNCAELTAAGLNDVTAPNSAMRNSPEGGGMTSGSSACSVSSSASSLAGCSSASTTISAASSWSLDSDSVAPASASEPPSSEAASSDPPHAAAIIDSASTATRERQMRPFVVVMTRNPLDLSGRRRNRPTPTSASKTGTSPLVCPDTEGKEPCFDILPPAAGSGVRAHHRDAATRR